MRALAPRAWLIAASIALIGPFFMSSAAGGNQLSDIDILLGLRDSITNWPAYSSANNITGWNQTTPVCLWTGVTCSDEGRVTTLVLQCNDCPLKAQGTLPDTLGGLDALTSLDLQNNSFTSSLPASWAAPDQFPAVLTMYLNSNNLSGPVPWVGSAFLNLQLLRLDDNQLSGTLDFLNNLTMQSLLVFRAFQNNFTGALSPTMLTGSPQLQILALQQNQLSGGLPPEWGLSTQFRNLREIYLQENNITGGLPAAWGQPSGFPFLQYAVLAPNPLGGGLPPEWGQKGSYPQLRSLQVNNASLEGPLPSTWADPSTLQMLTALDISGNNLTGDLNVWSNWNTLQRLTLAPGNPGICTSDPSPTRFELCNEDDPTCLRDAPTVPPCPGTPAQGEGSSGGGVPAAAIAVPLAVGIPALLLATLWFVVWRRRRRQRAAEEKRRLEEAQPPGGRISHPFDTLEGQEALTSPFASAAFSGVNAAAVVPAPNTTGRSSSSSASAGSFVSHCARIRTRSLDILSRMAGGDGGSSGDTVRAAGPATPAKDAPVSHISSDPSHVSMASSGNPYLVRVGSVELSLQMGTDVPFSDWEITPDELEIAKRPDGSDWELGSGGFGKVYKALRHGVQPVAVKKLAGGTESHLAQAEFRKEIALLRAMRDPNIVQFQGAYISTESTLLVTEYMEGGNLASNIQAGRVTWWKRGRKIALDVARGLVYLHSKRVIHFDMKSPNILLTRDGTAKIADVGMARFLARDYVTGAMGTLAWAAPEMLWGARCTEKADIYSFGIVLWEICTGEVPVRGQLRDIRVPEECPAEVRELVLECLETRPSRRPGALRIAERLRALPSDPAPMRQSPSATANVGGSSEERGESSESGQPSKDADRRTGPDERDSRASGSEGGPSSAV